MLPSLIDIYNNIDNRGFTIIPLKLSDNKYTVNVWLQDNFLRQGKETYKDWKTAMDETYKTLYKHLNKIQ